MSKDERNLSATISYLALTSAIGLAIKYRIWPGTDVQRGNLG